MAKFETEEHLGAFEYYKGLGSGRNYVEVARRFGKSISTIEKWASELKWQERLKASSKIPYNERVELCNLNYAAQNDFLLKQVNMLVLDSIDAMKAGKMTASSALRDLFKIRDELRDSIASAEDTKELAKLNNMDIEQLDDSIQASFKEFVDLKDEENRRLNLSAKLQEDLEEDLADEEVILEQIKTLF